MYLYFALGSLAYYKVFRKTGELSNIKIGKLTCMFSRSKMFSNAAEIHFMCFSKYARSAV